MNAEGGQNDAGLTYEGVNCIKMPFARIMWIGPTSENLREPGLNVENAGEEQEQGHLGEPRDILAQSWATSLEEGR